MSELGQADWLDNPPHEPQARQDYLQSKFAEEVKLELDKPPADADITPEDPHPQLPREPGESQDDWETRVKFGRR